MTTKLCECGIPPEHHPTRHDEHRLSAAREGVVKALEDLLSDCDARRPSAARLHRPRLHTVA